MGEEDASRGEQGGVVRAEVSGWWGGATSSWLLCTRDGGRGGLGKRLDWGRRLIPNLSGRFQSSIGRRFPYCRKNLIRWLKIKNPMWMFWPSS
jgi:hypothetical protein